MPFMNDHFEYGIDELTIGTAIGLASGRLKGSLSRVAIQKIMDSQQHVSDIVDRSITVYGINTGFGILANTLISAEDTHILQHKILQSHRVGVGEPVTQE